MADGQVTPEIKKMIGEKGLPPLIDRKFVTLCDGDDSIRIMQWNVLAQGLSGRDGNFIKCPEEALVFENRKLRIVEEIARYRPSILCAEEVDMFEYLLEQLSPLGYLGIFKPKPDSICLQMANNIGPDGCALIYNTRQLTLSESDGIILKDLKGESQNQVALIGQFQTKGANQKSFCVAVTHLKAKKYEALRAAEAAYICSYLNNKGVVGPLFVCGDFNAEPAEEACTVMKKELQLESTYTNLSADKSEPRFTTWKIRPGKEDCHVIDYIWYSKEIKVKAILDIPSVEEVGENRLPSLKYPSDHISLVADFLLE